MNGEDADAYRPATHRATGNKDLRLVPLRIYPDGSLEDAGFSDDQRFDLFAWLLQIGPGSADATLAIDDIMIKLDRGIVWVRVGVLGPTGYGAVDVILALQEHGDHGHSPVDGSQFIAGTVSSFAPLADAYIDAITGPRIGCQQLSLLDPTGRPTW